MKTLLIISFTCLALFAFDAALLRFTRLSLAEFAIIFGCAMSAVIVWTTAMNAYIKMSERNNNNDDNN